MQGLSDPPICAYVFVRRPKSDAALHSASTCLPAAAVHEETLDCRHRLLRGSSWRSALESSPNMPPLPVRC